MQHNNKKNVPHILLVDDDPLLRRLFGSRLSQEGYEILYAGNGEEGREQARRFQPDLILLDLRLPGIEDGYATAQRLKSEPQTAAIPIVFLTSQDLSIEAEKLARETLIVDYIHKGIDLNEFVQRIKKILGS